VLSLREYRYQASTYQYQLLRVLLVIGTELVLDLEDRSSRPCQPRRGNSGGAWTRTGNRVTGITPVYQDLANTHSFASPKNAEKC